MGRGKWFVRQVRYQCGEFADVAIYPVFQRAGQRRKKCKPTSEIQQCINQRNAARKAQRLIHTNFTPDDYALHLTYSDAPETVAEAQKILYRFIRKIKRMRKAAGLTALKYISATERSKTGRIHHHLIINGGLNRDAIEQAWGHGYANSKRLQFRENGVAGLAHYIVKGNDTFKRWNQSKNLIRPEPEIKDGQIRQEDMRLLAAAIEEKRAYDYFEGKFKGWLLTEAEYTQNGVNHGTYIHLDMRKNTIMPWK